MTRINLVSPRSLHVKHLVAEYRELPRIFGCVRAAQDRGLTPRTIVQPDRYVLGRGHMLFFYDKLAFLVKRQRALIEEMQARGYEPAHTRPETLLTGIRREWVNDWTPRPRDVRISRGRIEERAAKWK